MLPILWYIMCIYIYILCIYYYIIIIAKNIQYTVLKSCHVLPDFAMRTASHSSCQAPHSIGAWRPALQERHQSSWLRVVAMPGDWGDGAWADRRHSVRLGFPFPFRFFVDFHNLHDFTWYSLFQNLHVFFSFRSFSHFFGCGICAVVTPELRDLRASQKQHLSIQCQISQYLSTSQQFSPRENEEIWNALRSDFSLGWERRPLFPGVGDAQSPFMTRSDERESASRDTAAQLLQIGILCSWIILP